jgi:hypothetical protein
MLILSDFNENFRNKIMHFGPFKKNQKSGWRFKIRVARKKSSKFEKMLKTDKFQKFLKNTSETQFLDKFGVFALYTLVSNI